MNEIIKIGIVGASWLSFGQYTLYDCLRMLVDINRYTFVMDDDHADLVFLFDNAQPVHGKRCVSILGNEAWFCTTRTRFYVGGCDTLNGVDGANWVSIPWSIIELGPYLDLISLDAKKTKFCALLGKTSGFDRALRQNFADKLSKYRPVDILHSVPPGRRNKLDAIEPYRFNIAFENHSKPGYITEKPMDAFMRGVAPIWYGDKDTFTNLFPSYDSTLIVTRDNEDDVIERIVHYDKHMDEATSRNIDCLYCSYQERFTRFIERVLA